MIIVSPASAVNNTSTFHSGQVGGGRRHATVAGTSGRMVAGGRAAAGRRSMAVRDTAPAIL